jgi:hypothetical protein
MVFVALLGVGSDAVLDADAVHGVAVLFVSKVLFPALLCSNFDRGTLLGVRPRQPVPARALSPTRSSHPSSAALFGLLPSPSPGIGQSDPSLPPVRVDFTEVEMDGLLGRASTSRTIRTRAQFSSDPILFLH